METAGGSSSQDGRDADERARQGQAARGDSEAIPSEDAGITGDPSTQDTQILNEPSAQDTQILSEPPAQGQSASPPKLGTQATGRDHNGDSAATIDEVQTTQLSLDPRHDEHELPKTDRLSLDERAERYGPASRAQPAEAPMPTTPTTQASARSADTSTNAGSTMRGAGSGTGGAGGAGGAHSPASVGSAGSGGRAGSASDGIRHAAAGRGADEWLEAVPISRPLRGPRSIADVRRWNRRRKRYALYVRRSGRARQAARSATFTRAAWATMIMMGLLILSVLGGTAAAAASYYGSESALLAGLQRGVASKDSVRIYDDRGNLLFQLDQYGAQHSIGLARMPVDVINATVAIEDHDFWVNNGVDFQSIVRAATQDLSAGRITQGASTITQQLIKGQILGGDVSFQRKLEEAILAVGITESGAYSKSQIMEMYLNSISYSPTAYGIDAAAQEYFGYQDDPNSGMTAAQHLDLAQASMLAGIPQNPNTNDPLLHPQAAHTRQGDVLRAMVQFGYITPDEANAAWQESLQPNFFHPATEPNKAPHFVYYVINQIEQMIETGQLHNLDRSGLNVYTTLDMDLQNQAQQAMTDHLFGNDQTGYCCGLIRNANVSNAAEIMADQHTGAIKVYLGSIDYNSKKIDGKFDVVSQGFRGPGSAFKPFAYATAFEKGWFPALTIGDVPTVFWDAGAGVPYKPLDYDTAHMNGEVTLRTALDWSLNVPAVDVMQYAGIDNVKAQITRMGVTQTVGTWGLSSVLGAIQITPFEMAQAYTVFANYGQFIPLHAIDTITDSSSNVLYRYVVPQPVQVMDPRVAFLMTSILSDNASRAGDFGPCTPLYLDEYHGPGVYHFGSTEGAGGTTAECAAMYANHFVSGHAWPTAAKTGTGEDFKDDWTVGFTMDYTTAVWVGNNNDSPMYGIDGVTGAAPIFYQSMLYAEESQQFPKRPFPVPEGVHQAKYCSQGVCTTDWFIDGTAPRGDLGQNGTSLPCVIVLDNGGWSYGPPCQIGMEQKLAKNNGAPPPVTVNGQQYIGGFW